MQPRRTNSFQWTPFPEDFSVKIRQVFHENFQYETEMGEFHIEGRIYSEEIILRVGYLRKGRLRQDNFEASIDYSREKDGAAFKAIYACVDILGSVLEDFFEAEEDAENPALNDPDSPSFSKTEAGLLPEAAEGGFDFPKNWEEYETDEGTIYLQHSTVNTTLEAEADRLLAQADVVAQAEAQTEQPTRAAGEQPDKRLVYEAGPDDDALSRAIIDTELAFEVQREIRKAEKNLQ